MNNTIKLIIAIAIPLLIGSTSAFFTVTGVGSWYQTINKPSWNPLIIYSARYGQRFIF